MTSKNRSWMVWIVPGTIAVSFAGIAMLYFAIHRERKAFESQIEIGMLKNEVIKSVGTPDKILMPNESLEKFGNAETRMVHAETWVYHVFPESSNRFVLTFDGTRLAKIDFQLN